MKHITLIQLLFLRNRFIKSYKLCSNIFTELSIIKNSTDLDFKFTKLTNYISNADVIQSISTMLQKYYRWICRDNSTYYSTIAPKLSARHFLSSYVIAFVPEYALSEEQNSIEHDIYSLSQDLVNLNLSNLPKFVTTINKYSNAFKYFIHIDKIKKVNELIISWNNLEKTKREVLSSSKYSDDQKENVLCSLNKEQALIINFIRKTDRKFDTSLLKQLNAITEQFEKTMEKCYWDMLEQDINNDNYKFMINLLGEIRDDILLLHQKSKADLDEYFDIDFIEQKLNYQVLHFDDFLLLSDFLVEKIIYLQAPIRNTETKDSWNAIKSNALANIYDSEYKKIYANTATETIKFILKSLQQIKEDVIASKVLLSWK